VQLMKAVIPHLRLLTLSMDKLDQLVKYLSNSQMLFLTKRLVFGLETSVGNVAPTLNLNALARSCPQTRLNKKFKLELIAEDLIKSDWEMMGLVSKKNTLWKALQIKFVAEQHLFVKGIELLTRANTSPKFEVVSNNKEESSK